MQRIALERSKVMDLQLAKTIGNNFSFLFYVEDELYLIKSV